MAAMGLEPKKHLGKTLGMMQAHLLMLQDMYGVHCCGEGGEFESSTSSPAVGQYCNLTFCSFMYSFCTRIPGYQYYGAVKILTSFFVRFVGTMVPYIHTTNIHNMINIGLEC